MLTYDLDVFGQDDFSSSELYPVAKVLRGDDKQYGIELPYNNFANILTSPDVQWQDVPHPSNKWGGSDLAVLLRNATFLPLAAYNLWQYSIATGGKNEDGTDKVTIFNMPSRAYFNFADPAIKLSGVTKLFCLMREVPNTPIVLQTRGLVAKSLNGIIGGERGAFFNLIEKRLIVLSKRAIGAKDLTLPLKVSAKKENINGGWYRPILLNFNDEQLEQLKTFKDFEEFKASAMSKILLATDEEKKIVESLKPAAEEWITAQELAILNNINTNPYANFFAGCFKERRALLAQTNLVTALQSNDLNPVVTIDKLTNELEHNANVKRLTA